MKSMKALLVTVTSIVLTAAVIGNAYYQKKQFYPSVVYVIKSNPSMAVIYFQAFVFVLLMGKLMRKIFFGQLRAAEMEHLIERAWYAVTETCLAFTVFRDDLSPKFVALFTLLLFLKCFHWLAEDRVDFMERSPNISFIFHFRVISLLILLGSMDVFFVNLAYYSTLTKGASVQLVFGFEYAILFTAVINILLKYALHCLDLRRENPWENKAVCLLYTELLMGLLKVLLYAAFIVIMMRIHTFPLFAIRPMYLSIRALKKALNDVIMSRRAIRNMNTLYPNATAEDLANNDNICIICREEMTSNGTAKKLPCNHIFHVSCLRSWFQRQQTCPTCRMDVLRASPPTQTPIRPPAPGAVPQPNQPLLPAQAQMIFGPFLAHLANNMQNPNQPPPGPPGTSQQATSGASRPGTSSASSNASPTPSASASLASMPSIATTSGTVSANSAQVLRSVFALPGFVPFLSFPPSSNQQPNLSQLSEEELSRMEGNEREAIEARIRCLQNIKGLLDAAMAQLNQYQLVAGPLSVNLNGQDFLFSSTTNPLHSPFATSSTNNLTRSEPSTSATASRSSNQVSSSSKLHHPQSSSSSGGAERIPNENSSTQKSENHHSTTPDDIRKARIQRFSQTNTPIIDSTKNSVIGISSEANVASTSMHSADSSSNKRANENDATPAE